jgi:hypothetical protein
MRMSDLDRETLQTTLTHLESMVADNAIDPQWYHKALVDGAYQYVLNKDVGQALFLLGKIPAVYYSEKIKEHMNEDPGYAEQVFDIAKVLVNNNIVHVALTDTEIQTMQDA